MKEEAAVKVPAVGVPAVKMLAVKVPTLMLD